MTVRKHLTAPNAHHLRALITDGLLFDGAAIALAFGVSRSAIFQWLNDKSPTPRWTLLAAEGLRRRRRAEALTWYLIGLPANKPDAVTVVRTVVEGFGGKVHGKMERIT